MRPDPRERTVPPRLFPELGFAVGSTLLIVACSVLLAGSLSLWLGRPLSGTPLAVGAGAGVVYAWWVSARYVRSGARRAGFFAGATAGVIAVSGACLYVSGEFYDLSFDGQAYHQEAIIQLKEGWNPYTASRRFPEGPVLTWVSHYPKGSWINAAAVYAVTGRIEHGKAFNALLLVASFGLAVAALGAVPGLSRGQAALLSLLAALNPVAIYQALGYYVDGQMASLLVILASLSCLWLMRGDRLALFLVAPALVMTVNLKFTGLVYAVILVAGLAVGAALRLTRALAAATLAASAAALLVGVLLVGYNPYVTNIRNNGHIFFPLDGGRAARMLLDNMPVNFQPLNRFGRMFHAVFSESHHAPQASHLKLPFTVQRSELKAFRMPDVRVGGFGPLFGGAIILTAAVLVGAAPRRRPEALALAGVLLWILLSVGVNPEAWWARYAPQLWLCPIVALVVGFAARGRRVAAYASWALAGLLIADIALTAMPYLQHQAQVTAALRAQIAGLAAQRAPVLVSFDHFTSNRVRLREAGIEYREVGRPQCGEHVTLFSSTTQVCTGREPPTRPPGARSSTGR